MEETRGSLEREETYCTLMEHFRSEVHRAEEDNWIRAEKTVTESQATVRNGNEGTYGLT